MLAASAEPPGLSHAGSEQAVQQGVRVDAVVELVAGAAGEGEIGVRVLFHGPAQGGAPGEPRTMVGPRHEPGQVGGVARERLVQQNCPVGGHERGDPLDVGRPVGAGHDGDVHRLGHLVQVVEDVRDVVLTGEIVGRRVVPDRDHVVSHRAQQRGERAWVGGVQVDQAYPRHQPFTAPRMPSTKCFCRARKKMMMGSTAITVPAAIDRTSVPKMPCR